MKPNITDFFDYEDFGWTGSGWQFFRLTAKRNIPAWGVAKGRKYYRLDFDLENEVVELYVGKFSDDPIFSTDLKLLYNTSSLIHFSSQPI